jgi:hypothetical protein
MILARAALRADLKNSKSDLASSDNSGFSSSSVDSTGIEERASNGGK